MVKKIEFIGDSELTNLFDYSPIPAKSILPDWYKKTNRFIGNDKKPGLSTTNAGANNTTIKGCMPFYDALTSGYVITLPFDLELRKINNGIFLRWKTEESLVTTHAEEQAPLLPKPFGNEQGVVFKFGFEYVIKTPPGYSTLFTHPFNQHDLPFRTFSGVVDTDVFTLPVLFPFQVLDVFEDLYIVKQGTPVVQMIPFKRENWNKEVIKYNPQQTKINTINYLSTIVNAYKSKFWHRKSYK